MGFLNLVVKEKEGGPSELPGKEKGMKKLEKAVSEREKARERMEAAKAKYEEEARKFRAAEAAVTEAENLEYVRIVRELNLTIPEFESLKEQLRAGAGRKALPEKEEYSDEEAENRGVSGEAGREGAGAGY